MFVFCYSKTCKNRAHDKMSQEEELNIYLNLLDDVLALAHVSHAELDR